MRHSKVGGGVQLAGVCVLSNCCRCAHTHTHTSAAQLLGGARDVFAGFISWHAALRKSGVLVFQPICRQYLEQTYDSFVFWERAL